ncbi:MAG: helix-hairpin-helix domain-containing protein, partial [bacterium]|nr:helix-hairpin-helix domain-containing protein [bacterium]
ADLERVNLARIVSDGEQLHIPLKGEVATTGAPKVGDTRININTASQKELETLPGIGVVKGGEIINYRTKNGPFLKIEDLVKVSGIGEKTFEGLKHLVRVN